MRHLDSLGFLEKDRDGKTAFYLYPADDLADDKKAAIRSIVSGMNQSERPVSTSDACHLLAGVTYPIAVLEKVIFGKIKL
jgi:hypothetical protein